MYQVDFSIAIVGNAPQEIESVLEHGELVEAGIEVVDDDFRKPRRNFAARHQRRLLDYLSDFGALQLRHKKLRIRYVLGQVFEERALRNEIAPHRENHKNRQIFGDGDADGFEQEIDGCVSLVGGSSLFKIIDVGEYFLKLVGDNEEAFATVGDVATAVVNNTIPRFLVEVNERGKTVVEFRLAFGGVDVELLRKGVRKRLQRILLRLEIHNQPAIEPCLEETSPNIRNHTGIHHRRLAVARRTGDEGHLVFLQEPYDLPDVLIASLEEYRFLLRKRPKARIWANTVHFSLIT